MSTNSGSIESILADIKGPEILEQLRGTQQPLMLDYRGIGLTSIELLTLIVRIEESFGIELPESDLDLKRFQSLEDVRAWVAEAASTSR